MLETLSDEKFAKWDICIGCAMAVTSWRTHHNRSRTVSGEGMDGESWVE
jgi:hypothetical protein